MNVMQALQRAGWLAVAWLALLLPAAAGHAQPNILCCDDARGRPICGDTLPAACFGQAYREISAQGIVLRLVAAPPTPEDIARRHAEAQRSREEQERLQSQRRLDRALLETYPSLADIDAREARSLAEIDQALALIALRERELDAQRLQLLREIEFYAGHQPPRELSSNLRSVDTERAAYENVRNAKHTEREGVRARFAADRQRYVELIANGEARP